MTASKIFMSPNFLTRFIEEYRELPCLWKVRCADYMNKVKRDEAWEILMQVAKENIPEADLNFVKKKIDSIRASFRKELRKVRESDRSGASADETYKPALWYFELLSFTAEQEKPRESKSNVDEDVNDVMNEEEERAETSEDSVTKEDKWLSVVTEAMRERDNNLIVLKNELNAKLELLNKRDTEISQLKENILELTESLNEEVKSREGERSSYEIKLNRQQEKMSAEIQSAIDKEKVLSEIKLEELKTNHSSSIMELIRGMKQELEELELQLESEKAYSKKTVVQYEESLKELRIKENLLETIKEKLRNNNEQIAQLKNKCEQICCENKKLIAKLKVVFDRNEKLKLENLDLKNKNRIRNEDTVEKLEYMINTLNTNQEQEILLLQKLQKYADEKFLERSEQPKTYRCSVSIQTENLENKCISDLTNQLCITKSREEMLEQQIKCSEEKIKSVEKQNGMLKEVIRDMKHDRENKIRQTEQEEDEARVKRLEDKVKTLKDRSLLHNNGNSHIWIALSRFREELSVLKRRNWHCVTKHKPVQDEEQGGEQHLYIGDKELIKKFAVQETRPTKSSFKRN